MIFYTKVSKITEIYNIFFEFIDRPIINANDACESNVNYSLQQG